MSERSCADRFSREIDDLGDRSGQVDPEPVSTEFRQVLDMARTLIEADFSHESRVRQNLRRQLLNQIDQSGMANARKESMIRTHTLYPASSLRRALLTAIGGALVLLSALILQYPGGPSAAAQGVEDGAKVIVLGSYSVAQKIEAWATSKPMPSDGWNLALFPGAGIGGNGMPGSNPAVRIVTTLKEAQELAAFPIETPAYLPKGYSLREIKLAPIWTGPAELLLPTNPIVVLFYSGPGENIVIAEQPVGPQASSDPNMSVGAMTGFLTNGTLDQVEFNGHVAAWAGNRILLWQAGPISYMVAGTNLSLDEATQIARSIK